MRPRLAILVGLAVALLQAPIGGGGGTKHDGEGGALLNTWATNATNGGVLRPAGTSSCTSWAAAQFADPAFGFGDQPTTRTNAAGDLETLYFRICDSTARQFVWVGTYSAADLAQVAYSAAVAKVPAPVPVFSPPSANLIVNIETWFGVTPVAPVTATAQIPGLTSTVTATATELRLDTGSKVVGDTTTVTCPPWGSATASVGGCAWTPKYPSVQKVTGTTDKRYHATLTVTWSVTWSATNGQTGDLGTITTQTAVQFTVREIQTF